MREWTLRNTDPNRNDIDRHTGNFRPPSSTIQVFCLHCRHRYESCLIRWIPDRALPRGGQWVCPTPGCPGRGFRFDIWPTDPHWADDDGVKVRFLSGDDGPESEQSMGRGGGRSIG
jgi:hypothetical protein